MKQNITIEIFFFKNQAENDADRVVSDFILFLKKVLFEVEASGVQRTFNVFQQHIVVIQ